MQGKVSGLGIAMGYIGVFAVIVPVGWVYKAQPWLVFPFGGLMFFLFSLPMFLFVPERKPIKEEPITGALIKGEIRKFFGLFKRLKTEINLRDAFLANFLAVDAANTAILFFTTFLINAIFYDLADGPRARATQMQMMALTASCIVMSFVFGWLADNKGSKFAFFTAITSMGIASASGCLLPRGWTFYILVTLFGGAGLAGTWTAGRKLFADITPHGQEGDYFGLYGMANKSSALGTILFAAITYSLPAAGILSKPNAYRAAFLFPIATLALSLYFLKKVTISPKEEA
jgi:UMF1 family MFS transporter